MRVGEIAPPFCETPSKPDRRERKAAVLIRLATHADVPALVELMREFYAESSYPLDVGWASRAFVRLIDQPGYGAIWIILNGAEAVGHIVLSVRYTMEFGGLSGYIDDLFVRPGHRRKGAAFAAVDVLFEECRRRDCHSVHVEVGAQNEAAQALYRKFGMVPGDDDRETLYRRGVAR
jgi:ribosomal protein S18 acetylase RimI-like enzyme